MNPNTHAGAQAAIGQDPSRDPADGDNPYLIDLDHPLRPRVEDFIARRFLEVHGARIAHFMPTLLALQDEVGDIHATVGIRDAEQEALFLEYYLDRPVEAVLAARSELQLPPSRNRIVEIGNLASVDRHASRQLFGILTAHLVGANFEWAVFTGCGSLLRLFDTLGIPTFNLGRALQSRLPVEQQTWGGYYEDNPQVVAGRVRRGLDVFDAPPLAPVSGVLA